MQDAGFPPSNPPSDNEGDNDNEEANPEEEKMELAETSAAPEEEAKLTEAAKTETMNPEEKIFDRVVKVQQKTKLKGIRRSILEELGVQDMCTARLYAVKSESDHQKSG